MIISLKNPQVLAAIYMEACIGFSNAESDLKRKQYGKLCKALEDLCQEELSSKDDAYAPKP
jgi:hypothetical protein